MSDDNSTVGVEAELITLTKTMMRIADILDRIADTLDETLKVDDNLEGLTSMVEEVPRAVDRLIEHLKDSK